MMNIQIIVLLFFVCSNLFSQQNFSNNDSNLDLISQNKTTFGFRIGIDLSKDFNMDGSSPNYRGDYNVMPNIVIGYDTFINKSKGGFGIGFEYAIDSEIDEILPDIGFAYDIEIDILSFYTFYAIELQSKISPFFKIGYSVIGMDFIYDYETYPNDYFDDIYSDPDLMFGFGFIINKLQLSLTEHSSVFIDEPNHIGELVKNTDLNVSKLNLSYVF